MHSAPAVSYPVGRSHFQRWLLVAIVLTEIVSGVLWHEQSFVSGWRQWLFVVSFLIISVWAIQAWRATPTGHLRWDGQTWNWASGQVSTGGHLAIHLDLQFVLLLSLRLETGTRLWLWPERRNELQRWKALRRAVFSQRAKSLSKERRADGLIG